MDDHSQSFLAEPIPANVGDTSGWKKVALIEGNERLVPIGLFSDYPQLFTSSIYFGEHENSPYGSQGKMLEGASLTVFVRERVAERLTEAQNSLPSTLRLVIFDGRRSLPVQKSLHGHYLDVLIQDLSLDEETALQETEKYVSYPSDSVSSPSPHLTGGAVDVGVYEVSYKVASELQKLDREIADLKKRLEADPNFPSESSESEIRNLFLLSLHHQQLIQDNGKLLNFGTPFDFGGPEAALTYYEQLSQTETLTGDELEAQNNRRMLYSTMMSVGFEAYADEWWHYNAPESQMGAKTSGARLASYGLAGLVESHLSHEQVRVDHWLQQHRIYLSRGQSAALPRRSLFPMAATIGPLLPGNAVRA